MKRRIQIQGLLIFLGVALIVFYHKKLLQGAPANIWDIAWNITGVLMVLLGYFLRISSRGCKAELNPDGKTLVTKGPYLLMRNPMYFGTLLIGLGTVLFLFQWWVALIFLAIYLVIYLPQVNREEKKLFGLFPQSFRDYCKTVPKFFPNIALILRMQPKEYLPLKPAWIKKEGSSLVLMVLFMLGLKLWEISR